MNCFQHNGLPENPTNQEIFNHVVDYLARQGGPSVKELPFGSVHNRLITPQGKRCALGCLLNLEQPESWEAARSTVNTWDTVMGQIPHAYKDFDFLNGLRRYLHDEVEASTTPGFQNWLDRYGLTDTRPTDAWFYRKPSTS